jgi:mono/diheme cytochrome c family protein
MPTTAGNPQPFGMPPFGQVLNNDEIAAVSSFIRQSWGNSAAPVSSLDVLHVK